jgi:hypothetical protein
VTVPSNTDGADMTVTTQNGTAANQRYAITKVGDVYRLMPKNSTSKYVEVEGTAGNYHTAGPIQIWEGVSTSAGWVLEELIVPGAPPRLSNNQIFYLKNKNSGQYLTATANSVGASVVQKLRIWQERTISGGSWSAKVMAYISWQH